MMALADLVSGRGLEIGPLDRAIAERPDWDVRYVDVFDTAGIRDHYRDDPMVDTARIPDVDFPLQTSTGSIQTLAEAAAPAAPYRWVLASHVIEHVPDVIGWLADIAAVLEDGGRLVLAIPDRRVTFDSLRPPTTVGQMIQAHLSGDSTPALRAVFDHFRSAVHVSSTERWAGRPVGEVDVIHGLTEAMEKVEIARTGEYVDCHVWLFTPSEFVGQMGDLAELGLTDLYVSAVVPTAKDEIEYYVALSRMPRGCSATEAARTRALAACQVLNALAVADDPDRPGLKPVADVANPGEPARTLGADVRQNGSPDDETPVAPHPAATAATEFEPSSEPDEPAGRILSGREVRIIVSGRRAVAGLRARLGLDRH